MLRVDEAMQHNGVERKQGTGHDYTRISVGITIGNPALPPRTHAQKTVIFTAAPDGVRILQPKRRGIRARRQVDINVGLHGSPFVDQADRRLKVTVKSGARKGSVGVSGAIDFELIDAKLSNEVQRSFTE